MYDDVVSDQSAPLQMMTESLSSSSLALAKLLRHAIMTNDPRLHNIVVLGEPIESSSAGIRTRSKAKACEWHAVQSR